MITEIFERYLMNTVSYQ